MVALPYKPDSQQLGQLRRSQTVGTVLAASMRFAGVVLILSSLGIWLVPATSGDGMVVFMKLLVSVMSACVGAVLINWGQTSTSDEIHMDTEARQLAHIQRNGAGITRIRARHDFDDVADIRMTDGNLTVIGKCGLVLVQLPVESLENLDVMRGALRGDGAQAA
ncbi:hypothetical protein [Lacimonas salitolerans]|uniref:PH domain-containing protein n=1 Tax=Lacimonas salitolerans TaxID=1323750 RepID=A0ABW4EE83_9RHOB